MVAEWFGRLIPVCELYVFHANATAWVTRAAVKIHCFLRSRSPSDINVLHLTYPYVGTLKEDRQNCNGLAHDPCPSHQIQNFSLIRYLARAADIVRAVILIYDYRILHVPHHCIDESDSAYEASCACSPALNPQSILCSGENSWFYRNILYSLFLVSSLP